MTIKITNVNRMGEYTRITATGEFNLKVPRGSDFAYDFPETKLTLSDDDTKAIQKAIDDDGCHLVNEIIHHPEGIDVDGVILIAERHYFQGRTGLYRIRDVRDTPDSRFRCEYATIDEAGNTVWKPCREGVNFDEIQPFEPIAA
jgi:hypothetical protein